MFDIGWQEIMIVCALALIVVGPKDLPRVLRTVMLGVRKVKGMAREFQDGVDEMVREADLDDFRKEMEKIKRDEIERDLKHGVIDNSLNFDGVKDDLNKIANSDTPKPAIAKTGQAKSTSKNETEAVTDTKQATTKAENSEKSVDPAKSPVKRKTRGSAKPTAKTPAKTAAKTASKSPTAAKKAPAKQPAKRKTSTAAKSAPKKKADTKTGEAGA